MPASLKALNWVQTLELGLRDDPNLPIGMAPAEARKVRDQGRLNHICHGLASDRYGVRSAHIESCLQLSRQRFRLDCNNHNNVLEFSVSLAEDAAYATMFSCRLAMKVGSSIMGRGAGADTTSKAFAPRARWSEPGDRNSPGDRPDLSIELTENGVRLARLPNTSGT